MLIDVNKATESEIIDWLKTQDDLFHNEGDAPVDDCDYDVIRKKAELMFPTNEYFTGIGADVRGGKIKLPIEMLGLTQIYEGEICGWVTKATSALDVELAITDKLDGTSAQVIYGPDGKLQIAFSRGNGVEGADITRHIRKIPNIPNQIESTGKSVPVRLECVIPKELFEEFRQKFPKPDNSLYRNPRNATAGSMNASKNASEKYNYLRGVAYTIMDSNESKQDQLEFLRRNGFDVARVKYVPAGSISDESLAEYLNIQRASSEYDIDGIVLDINDATDREYAKNHAGQCSIKYKVADTTNYAEVLVVRVEYTLSKDGYLKPTVWFKPTELAQVTVQKATGHNAGYIRDNNIGPGAVVGITRSGDVVPYILHVKQPASAPQLPDDVDFEGWTWTETEVDAFIENVSENRSVQIKLLADVFTKLKISMLKEGNISKLYDAGYTTTLSIITADPADLWNVLGSNGFKISDSIADRLSGIYWPEFVGSLNLLGRGIGIRKISKLYSAFKGDTTLMSDPERIAEVESFDMKTATKIADNINNVHRLLEELDGIVTFTEFEEPDAPIGSAMVGQSVVFTGFRNADLEKQVIEQGGEIKSGVSNKITLLVCKDPSSNSGKAKKARDLGIEIISVSDLEKRLYGI